MGGGLGLPFLPPSFYFYRTKKFRKSSEKAQKKLKKSEQIRTTRVL